MADETDTEMDGETDEPNTPVADQATIAKEYLANELTAFGVSGIVIYYTVVAAAWLGQDVGFLAVAFPREMLAGLLLFGLVIDRFVDRDAPIPPVVIGYTTLALIVVGVRAGTLNMPFPDTTVSGALLALLFVDYYTPDRG